MLFDRTRMPLRSIPAQAAPVEEPKDGEPAPVKAKSPEVFPLPALPATVEPGRLHRQRGMAPTEIMQVDVEPQG